jgi:uncharacterized protein
MAGGEAQPIQGLAEEPRPLAAAAGRWSASRRPNTAATSCWENAGRPGWEVGTLADGYADADTVKDRWVACDFDTEPHGDARAARAFVDKVDGAALDEQRRLKVLRAAGQPY